MLLSLPAQGTMLAIYPGLSPASALQGADADLVSPGIRGIAEGEWTCLPTMVFAHFQSIPCSLTSGGFLVALGSNTGRKHSQTQHPAGPGSLAFTIQQSKLQGWPVGDNTKN